MTIETLKFDLKDYEQTQAFARLIQALNASGVPWTLCKEKTSVTITITNGY